MKQITIKESLGVGKHATSRGFLRLSSARWTILSYRIVFDYIGRMSDHRLCRPN